MLERFFAARRGFLLAAAVQVAELDVVVIDIAGTRSTKAHHRSDCHGDANAGLEKPAAQAAPFGLPFRRHAPPFNAECGEESVPLLEGPRLTRPRAGTVLPLSDGRQPGSPTLNPRILLLLGLTLGFELQAQTTPAAQHLAEARRLGRLGSVERAVEEFNKAIAAAPTEWRYSYSLGEYLLSDTERWGDARTAYEAAWDKGYRRGITRHKIALALYRMGKLDDALAEFRRAIEMHEAALPTAKGHDAMQLRFQIADSYFWYGRSGGASTRATEEKSERALSEALGLDPGNAALRHSTLQFAHHAFGDGKYEHAVQLYRLAFEDPVTRKPRRDVPREKYQDWGIAPDVMLDLAENRLRLGRIEPQYTHRLLVVFYQGITEFRGGMRSRVFPNITAVQKQDAEAKLRWLVRVVESLSDGQLSLSVIASTEARPESGQGLESPHGFLGDARVLAESINEVDTIVRVWGMPNRMRAWVGIDYPDLRPNRSTSARRALLNIGPDHPHGIWLHEFFHVLEDLAGISPAHGYGAEQRRDFPGWKGRSENEMDYYRWHFGATLPRVGWTKLNYRLQHALH